MGIIEFHLHEPDFDFSPSMTRGVEADDEASTDKSFDVDDESGGSKGGALVALVVLVAIAALVGLKRRRGSEEEDYEENVDVAD